jgi:hypothetical protein
MMKNKKSMLLLAVVLVGLFSCKKEVIEPTIETVTVYETITEESQLKDLMLGNWTVIGVTFENDSNELEFTPIPNIDMEITSDSLLTYGNPLSYTVLSCNSISFSDEERSVLFSADTMFFVSLGTIQDNSYVLVRN